jgi:hypothetical protein
MNNQEIAGTILKQLGGSRVSAMLGVKNFMAIENGLQISFSAKAKNKANVIRIKLNANDTYNVQFIKVRGFDVTDIDEAIGVYADNLKAAIETRLGLALSL